ncbi:Hypothetical predicted protein [Mytilus galloprovincialis]|uniref:CARD domain-containing protein n=1 Tax=Mytilus galloprovincialis TaxID=29158 RepID=A0A8B6BRD8_MYTGA|nr:Hypothetical predicted protein [Mytilus galloprovincialis]
MASNEPQNLLEWQLHCVLKRASLLQYYDSFVKHDECDVLQLSEADDEKFKDVMEKVGMANTSRHVRQFKSTLLQWAKDPEEQKNYKIEKASLGQNTPQPEKRSTFSSFGKIFKPWKWKRKKRSEKIEKTAVGQDKYVPNFINDSTTSPAQGSLKPDTVSFSTTGKSSEVPQLKNSTQEIKTKEKEELTSYKSEKKTAHPKEDTTPKYTQSVIKDQEHHDLTGYYDELLDNTVLDKMVLDNLISRCILMIEDREEIVKPTTQRERNKVLLDILTERPYPTFHLFKDVLLESEPSNSCVQELVKRMMSTESRDEHISWQGHEIGK